MLEYNPAIANSAPILPAATGVIASASLSDPWNDVLKKVRQILSNCNTLKYKLIECARLPPPTQPTEAATFKGMVDSQINPAQITVDTLTTKWTNVLQHKTLPGSKVVTTPEMVMAEMKSDSDIIKGFVSSVQVTTGLSCAR